MQPIVRPLLLLHSDPELRELLERIPGQLYALHPVPDWQALGDVLRRSPPTAVAVVDPFLGAAEPGGLSEALPALLRSFPWAAVLAALPATPGAVRVMLTLGEWGVADVVDLVRERTPEALARRLRVVQGRAVERMFQRALPDSIPGRTRAFLAVAAEVVAQGGQVPELAAAMGVSERTVARWCRRADLPPARRLLAWLRILLAADLLDDPGRSLEAVARACGYAGAASLKTAVRGLLGTTPRELRAQGGFRAASRAFGRELLELREQARARGKPERSWLH